MKTLLTATLIALAATAHAGGEHAGHAPTAKAARSAAMPLVDGQVKKVDKAAGKVTLAHGPLTNLDMPAMTMAFKLANAAWSEQMQAGDRIRFKADSVDGVITVVHFEAAR